MRRGNVFALRDGPNALLIMDGQVQRLKDAGARFSQTYTHFSAIPVELRPANYDAVKSLADMTRQTVSELTRAMDTALGWANAAFGFKASDAYGIFPDAPMVATGTIGAAVSAIMLANHKMQGVINEAMQKQAILAANAQRAEDGVEPIQLAAAPAQSVFGGFETWAIIGGAALFLLPQLLEKMRDE